MPVSFIVGDVPVVLAVDEAGLRHAITIVEFAKLPWDAPRTALCGKGGPWFSGTLFPEVHEDLSSPICFKCGSVRRSDHVQELRDQFNKLKENT